MKNRLKHTLSAILVSVAIMPLQATENIGQNLLSWADSFAWDAISNRFNEAPYKTVIGIALLCVGAGCAIKSGTIRQKTTTEINSIDEIINTTSITANQATTARQRQNASSLINQENLKSSPLRKKLDDIMTSGSIYDWVALLVIPSGLQLATGRSIPPNLTLMMGYPYQFRS
ncbi:MAG: hypothetical protein WC707_02300 [Candidatus Babeliaceae bacterium]